MNRSPWQSHLLLSTISRNSASVGQVNVSLQNNSIPCPRWRFKSSSTKEEKGKLGLSTFSGVMAELNIYLCKSSPWLDYSAWPILVRLKSRHSWRSWWFGGRHIDDEPQARLVSTLNHLPHHQSLAKWVRTHANFSFQSLTTNWHCVTFRSPWWWFWAFRWEHATKHQKLQSFWTAHLYQGKQAGIERVPVRSLEEEKEVGMKRLI